jgi:hypothetical protein
MDVESVSHLYKESRSLDIVRALVRADNTVQTTVQAKVQHEQGWTRKSAISVCAAEIAGTVLSSKEPVIGDAAVVEPPLAVQTLNHKIPSLLSALCMLNLGILTFHCTHTQLWNQAPLQVEPIPTQADSVPKVLAMRKEVRRVFVRRRMMHGPLASVAILCKETSLLCCRLRVRASLGSHTCGIFLVVF